MGEFMDFFFGIFRVNSNAKPKVFLLQGSEN